MKPSITDALRIGLIVATCAMLVTGVQGMSPDADLNVSGRNVSISSVDVHGQQVAVTVSNHGIATTRVTVTIQATHADGSQTASATTVTVFGRQKAFVVFTLRAPSIGTPVVGMIVDDPCPF